MLITEKTVLITGVARGIGLATAVELANAGANIVGVDLDAGDMEHVGQLVRERGREFQALVGDISNEADVMNLKREIEEMPEGVDILVNNAGVLPSGSFVERDFGEWRRTLEINLTGLMHLTHTLLPHLLTRESAHIVNIASIAGKFGSEGVVAYSASKHGVVGFSSALRSELAGSNVGVSWLCPNPARTRLANDVAHTFLTPLVHPEQVARAVRKAIETNAIEVFVPASARFVTSLFPSLAPRFSRWLSGKLGASRGWRQARQKIQV